MYKGDRPRDSVWQNFLEVTVNGKSNAKCKHCGNQQLPKAGRLKQHQEKCAKLPGTHSDMIDVDVRLSEDTIAITSHVSSVKRARSASPPPAERQAIPLLLVVSFQRSCHCKLRTHHSRRHHLECHQTLSQWPIFSYQHHHHLHPLKGSSPTLVPSTLRSATGSATRKHQS